MAAEDRKAFLLRLPPELWREIEAWAADELRSVNGQIEFVLRAAVRRRRHASADADGAGASSQTGRSVTD
jgi:hypothetical protein